MNTTKDTGDTAKSWESRDGWVAGTRQCIQANIDSHDCLMVHNIMEHIKTLVHSLLAEQREEMYNEVTLIDELYQDPDTMRVWNRLKNKVLQIINSKK